MKKFIAALLCVMMLVSSVVSASALTGNSAYPDIIVGNEYTVGDANDDGAVNAIDDLEIKKYCVDLAVINANGADINADGVVNAKDLLILKKCHAGADTLANYESDETIANFTIAGNPITEYDIVYHADAKYVENNYYAADTLRKFINLATGYNLGTTTVATKAHKIEFVDVTTIEGLEEELEIENYKYEVVDGDLFIYGTRRGAMYAVYEILEEYLGFRFYNDTFTYQYAARAADIPEDTNVFLDSYLEFRICKQGFWREDQVHYFPMRLNGSQHGDSSETMGTLTGPHWINAHSFGKYWQLATGDFYVDIESGKHSYGDYKAKENAGVVQNEAEWNPCFTSDGVYATLFRGLLEAIRYCQSWGHTFREDTSLMSFSICDNRTVCTCAECKFISNSGTQGRNPNLIYNLNCGEAGLNLYIANRACDDIKAYYEGRPASIDEKGTGIDGYEGFGQGIKDFYPTLRLYTILYDHTFPHEKLFSGEGYAAKYGYGYEAIIPRDNLCIMFCGNPCNNHYMGAYECNGNKNLLGLNGEHDAEAFAAWGDVTKQSGATMWFWYYPVNYNTYVTDSPNVFNIWYDCKYVIEECNVSGIYYEGASKGYIFENLKSHLAAKFMWSMVENEDGTVSYMSYDEFIEALQEYLQIHYGKGWEYVYEYICMQDEAANVNVVGCQDGHANPILDENGQQKYAVSCYINNCDYMGDMFNYEYMRDNYEYMRNLIVKAMALSTPGDKQMYQRYEFLLMNVEMIGLSAVRKSWYLSDSATAEQKATYMERYDWLYNFLVNETLNDGDGINGREWNGNDYSKDLGIEEFKRVIVSANQPLNWMKQLADLEDYYKYSPYGLVTGSYTDDNQNGKYDVGETFEPGGEAWCKYTGGWEWTGSVPGWGYAK